MRVKQNLEFKNYKRDRKKMHVVDFDPNLCSSDPGI